MNGSRGTFEFMSQSVGVPATRTKDQTKYAKQTTEPFALSSTPFSVGPLPLLFGHTLICPISRPISGGVDLIRARCQMWVVSQQTGSRLIPTPLT